MTREDAIKTIQELKRETNDNWYKEVYDMAIEALKEQKTGKWIIFPPFIEEICMCSNCKTKFKEAYQHRDTCPSCGAKMEKEQ